MSNTLEVNGVVVTAPHCPNCGKNDMMDVMYCHDRWYYACRRCKRILSYDEIEGLNI